MEKFYLGNLETNSSNNSNSNSNNPRAKLVELNFERKPPSFGVVYLEFCDNFAGRQYPSHVGLRALDLPPNQSNEATFRSIRRVELPRQLKVVDFDVSAWIFLDDDDDGDGAQRSDDSARENRDRPDCVLLDDGGNLHSLKLTDGSISCLIANGNSLMETKAGRPIRCKLVTNGGGEDESAEAPQRQPRPIVHVLHERSHFAYELSGGGGGGGGGGASRIHQQVAKKVASYSLLSSAAGSERQRAARFAPTLAASNRLPSVAITELSGDGRKLILHNSSCLAQIDDLNQSSSVVHQLLGCDDEKIILLSSSGLQIAAHSILVSSGQQDTSDTNDSNNNNNTADDTCRDPDQLLPRVPSFELEKCWTFELGELESLRFLVEDEELNSSIVSMCPIWSSKQNDAPKFLLVTLRFHLILLSFEQEPVQPFSVIYDRNFLKVTPMLVVGAENNNTSNNQQQQQQDVEQEFIDVKLKPKLVMNLKLIGPKPNDSLFNTLFLAKQPPSSSSIVLCRHFPQMALLVGLMDTGQVLAFKLPISELVGGAAKESSVYQKLVGNSLRGSSALLADQIGRLEEINSRLAASLESTLDGATGAESANRQSVLKIDLEPRADSLYELSLNLVCVQLVGQIVVVCSVPGAKIVSYPPDLNAGGGGGVTIDDDSRALLMNFRQDDGYDEGDRPFVDSAIQVHDRVELQMFIPNYSTGSIEIYTTLAAGDEYCLDQIPIRPLSTYQLAPSAGPQTSTQSGETIRIVIKSEENSKNSESLLASCLSECFSCRVDFSTKREQVRLESAVDGSHFVQFDLLEFGGRQTLQVSGTDRVALDLIKKIIMRLATECSLELEMTQVS